MSSDQQAADASIVHRQVDPHSDEGGVDIVELVADLEGLDATDLNPLYGCVDGLLQDLFSEPPASEAQVEVSFTYTGYRISVDQSGYARLMPVE